MKKQIIRIFTAMLTLLPSLYAQESRNMEVKGFKAAPTDMDARVNYPQKDWNDETCALIKVQTTLKGLSFDTGTITPTKVEQKQGECWVYVSPKIFKFNISHDDFTPLRYELPMAVESACVYYLTLDTVGPQNSGTMVHIAEVTSGYLKLSIEPQDEPCTIYIGKTRQYELPSQIVTDGFYSQILDFGEYCYKVESKYYQTEYGSVSLSESTGTQEIKLLPAYNYLKINSTPESGAGVFINDEYAGKTPLTYEKKLAKGEYRLRLSRQDYAMAEQTVTLNGDGLTKEVSIPMTPQYATVTCLSESPEAEIWVDDQLKGKGSWTGRLSESSTHKLEARLANHYSQSKSFTVHNGETLTVSVPAPIAKMAMLNVTSSPARAKVLVDGKDFGEAPLLKKLLMGRHEVSVSLHGYETAKYTVDLAENQTHNLNATLKKVAIPASQIPNQVWDDAGSSHAEQTSHPELGSGSASGLPVGANLSAAGTANCYIVSSAGDYGFKTVKGNSAESVGAVVSAEVLWESFGTHVKPDVGDLVSEVKYENGVIRFTASALKGNAVIAAKDANDHILWSWHIWLTDKPVDQTYNNKAGTMMDRNLGATSAAPGDVGALGLFYQWGRKDPFLGSSSITAPVVAKSTNSWPPAIRSNEYSGTMKYAISHPMTFITSGGRQDWEYAYIDQYKDKIRWKSAKTIHDPCPVGYRVPDGGNTGVWAKAFGTSSNMKYQYSAANSGINFGYGSQKEQRAGRVYPVKLTGFHETCRYPVAGYLNFNNGSLCNTGSEGGCWACTWPNDGSGHAISFMSGYWCDVYPANYPYRASGYSVRCQKE